MSWGAVIGAAGGLLASSMDKKGGGGGSSTTTSDPWAPATPWLMQNLLQGQALQSQYQARPFSARQQAAFDNSYAANDYVRGLIPSLLGQMQSQPVGFDKSNRSARPKAWDWNALADGMGQRRLSDVQEPTAGPAAPDKQFVQQDLGYTPLQQELIKQGRNPWMAGETQYTLGNGRGNGSYGSYTYGDNPTPGTPAYRDMMEFFLMGGNDPMNLAPGGFGIKRAPGLGGLNGGPGISVGDGIGVAGSAASVGSSANF